MEAYLPEPLRRFAERGGAWARVANAPPEHAHAVRDVSAMNALFAVQMLEAVFGVMELNRAHAAELGFREGEMVMHGIVGAALATGIHYYAALSRDLDTPPRPIKMGPTKVLEARAFLLDDDHKVGMASTAAVESVGDAKGMFGAWAVWLADKYIEAHPKLAPARVELAGVAYTHMHIGARVEQMYSLMANA